MLRSILVPVDTSAEGTRGLRLAARIAGRTGAPLEVLHVRALDVSPEVAEWQLRSRAEELGARVPCTTTLLQGEDTVEALLAALADRPDGLVVLGTAARGPIGELLLGSVSEALLARSDRPLLLAGPRVDPTEPLGPSLVAAVAQRNTGERLVEPLALLTEALGAEPWFVQVAAPNGSRFGRGGDVAETGLVHRLADQARRRGLDAQWDVLHGRNAPAAIIDFTASMGGGIVAVASERWADPTQVHWSSTARTLVNRSPFPVLVVPVHTAAVSSG